MGRFLIHLSYIGTRYSGIQIYRETRTVAGVLHQILSSRYQDTDIDLRPLSRTDAGVHAVCNPLLLRVFDMDISNKIDPERLTLFLNVWLKKIGEEILIHKVQRIATYSTEKSVTQRSYMYRLGVIKSVNVSTPQKEKWMYNYLSMTGTIFHTDRCHLVCPPFDMDKFLEAAGFLCGQNNYYHFTTTSGLKTFRNSLEKNMEIEVKRGQPSFTDFVPDLTENVEYWEVHFKSSGFIYRQIRRMMGYMIRYAKDKFDVKTAKRLVSGDLDMKHVAVSQIHTLPPNGLYLMNVKFNQDAIKYDESVEHHPFTVLRANISHLKWLLESKQKHNTDVTLSKLLLKGARLRKEKRKSDENVTSRIQTKNYFSKSKVESTEKWMNISDVFAMDSGLVVVNADQAFVDKEDIGTTTDIANGVTPASTKSCNGGIDSKNRTDSELDIVKKTLVRGQ